MSTLVTERTTDLESIPVEDEVAEAARILDRLRPGWAAQIDLGILNLMSPSRCILGQLWSGDFAAGYDAVREAGYSGEYAFAAQSNVPRWAEEVRSRT